MSTRSVWNTVALLLALVAVFAPLVATNLPLLGETSPGSLRFPAVAAWLGADVAPPEGHTWTSWVGEQQRNPGRTCVLAPWPHGPDVVDTSRINNQPSWSHPLGCDDLGRDVLSRMLHGTRSALATGLLAALLAMAAGVVLGGLAGTHGSWVDAIVLRMIELFLCFPALFLALVAGSLLGPSSLALACVVGAVSWPSFARLVRAEVLAMRNADFVLAARGFGASQAAVLCRHMLPQLRDQIAVCFALVLAQAVVVESTLSFLGLGIGGPSWGALLAQGKDQAHLGAWHLWVFPAAAIVVTVLCCHAFAERRAARAR